MTDVRLRISRDWWWKTRLYGVTDTRQSLILVRIAFRFCIRAYAAEAPSSRMWLVFSNVKCGNKVLARTVLLFYCWCAVWQAEVAETSTEREASERSDSQQRRARSRSTATRSSRRSRSRSVGGRSLSRCRRRSRRRRRGRRGCGSSKRKGKRSKKHHKRRRCWMSV